MFIVNYKQKSERCGLVIKKPNSNSEKLEGIGSRTWKINGTGTVSQLFETLRLTPIKFEGLSC